MQEKYSNISSYAYCAGNPVRFTDLLGYTIYEGSRDEWNSQINKIQIMRFVLIFINEHCHNQELDNRINYLNDLIYGLMYLDEESSTIYELNPSNNSIGLTQYNPKNGHIVFTYNGTANFVHESVHGIQFELGEIIFHPNDDDDGLRNATLIDVFDEIGVYRFQYSFNPTSLNGISEISINTFNDINMQWLNKIFFDGEYIYNPEYNGNIGVISIGTNNYQEFFKAYPKIIEMFPDLNFKLDNYYYKIPHN